MTVDTFVTMFNPVTDFRIEYEYRTVYDSTKTPYDYPRYIAESIIETVSYDGDVAVIEI